MSPAAPTATTTTERASAFVAAHLDRALALGREAGELVQAPIPLVAFLRTGLEGLADPEYLAGQQMIAPGIGPQLGVRQPLLTAVSRGLRAATRQDRPGTLLDVATALLRDPLAELHWLAIDLLDRTVTRDAEPTWQLVRAEAARATEWVTVDRLARVAGRGVLAEPYRWAELEQLVYSPSRWERRLAASTVATVPHVDRAAGRTPDVVRRGLGLMGDLLGDAEPDVQKALAWALRTLATIDLPATAAFLRAETRTARATGDGHRAWVIRDTFEKLPAPLVQELGAALAGIRRRHGAPSTSRAAATAAQFLALGLAVPPAERTVIDRS